MEIEQTNNSQEIAARPRRGKTKIIIFLILILALVFGCVIWQKPGLLHYLKIKLSTSNLKGLQLSNTQLQIDPSIKVYPTGTTLPLFPKDFPMEEKSTVLLNYVQTKNNKQQDTRKFTSSKGVEENFKLYTSYLQGSQWQTVNSFQLEKFKQITAKKGLLIANISIKTNSASTGSVIEASFISSDQKLNQTIIK